MGDTNERCLRGHNRLNHEAHAPIDGIGSTPTFRGFPDCACRAFRGPSEGLTKEGLTAYFRDFLGGDRGTASAEVLADVVLCAVYQETERLKTDLQTATAMLGGKL